MALTALDELKKSYKNLLAGSILVDTIAIPIYVDTIDLQANPSEYILIQSASAVGNASKQDLGIIATIQFVLFSRRLSNNGSQLRQMAKQFYDIVYSDTLNQTVILDVYQNITMQLVSDNMMAGLDTANIDKGLLQVYERIIIFKHKIS